jgi:hypothetical protein
MYFDVQNGCLGPACIAAVNITLADSLIAGNNAGDPLDALRRVVGAVQNGAGGGGEGERPCPRLHCIVQSSRAPVGYLRCFGT